MVIFRIGNLNLQLVKDNFATRKYYHLKLSARKCIILTRKKQLAIRKIKFNLKNATCNSYNYFIKFTTR